MSEAESTTENKLTFEFAPEERKNWPPYIKRRFETLDAAYHLDLPHLLALFSEDSSLLQPVIVRYLDERYGQLPQEIKQKNNHLTQGMFHLFSSLATDESQNSEIHEAAINAVSRFGKISLPILKGLTINRASDGCRYAVQALGNLKEEALPILTAIINSKFFISLRMAAAESLSKIGEKAWPVFRTLLSSREESEVREIAIGCSSRFGEKALPLIAKLAKTDGNEVRQVAIRSLGDYGEKVVDDLKILARNENEAPHLRGEAILSLGKLEDESSLPLLFGLADCYHSRVREKVAEALGRFSGQNTNEILLGLEKLAKDRNSRVA